MTDERPSRHKLPIRRSGATTAKHVRLSAHPEPYRVVTRVEPGPEARPAATIHGPFRPITNRGPETVVKRRHSNEPPRDTDFAG